jgi:hypothetical protein
LFAIVSSRWTVAIDRESLTTDSPVKIAIEIPVHVSSLFFRHD